MPNGDAMINSVPTTQPTTAPTPSALPPVQQKGPSAAGRIFRGILGGALNIVAPGAGSLIGGFLNGGGVDSTNVQAMLDKQAQQAMMLLSVQNSMQTQTQEFTTVSNLLKAKHDGEMSAVHNFKS